MDAQTNGRRTPIRLFSGFLVAVFFGGAALLAATAWLGDSPQLAVSDGKAYYAWTRSVLLDRDVDFSNDYAMAYPPDPLPPEANRLTPRGLPVNKYPVGMGLLSAPGFGIGHLVARCAAGFPADGLSLPYQGSVGLSLLLFSVAGIGFLFRAQLHQGVSPAWAALVSAAALTGTNLVHYLAKEPVMPHAAGLALLSWIVYDITRPGLEQKKIGPVRPLVWGGAMGLLFLVRNSNLFAVPFLGWLLARHRGLRFRILVPLFVGWAATVALQPLSLFAVWGDFRLVTYPDEGFSRSLAGIAGTLFSARHGLFVYHPWYLGLLGLTAIGLARPARRGFCASVLASFFLLWLINGTWHCWWFGDSFGNRAFIEALVPLSMAAGRVLTDAGESRKRWVCAGVLLVLFSVVNAWLWAGYLVHGYPPDGRHTLRAAYGWAWNSN